MKKAACVHCGTPFTPTPSNDKYCCNGCAFVHRMLQEEGFEQFYDFKSGPIQPVGSRAFAEPDWERIEPVFAAAEEAARERGETTARAAFRVEGISCIGCVWLVERLFRRLPGAVRISIDAQTARISLYWTTGRFAPRAFVEAIQPYGYLLAPAGTRARGESRDLAVRIGLAGAFAMNTMLFTLPVYLGMEEDFPFARLFSMVALASATFSLLLGGSWFIVRAWTALRDGFLHADVPIALGLVLAYAGSLLGWFLGRDDLQYFDFVSIFTFLMLAGRWAQEATLERNRSQLLDNDLREQLVLSADSTDEAPERIPVSALRRGMRIRLRRHDIVPVESRLAEGVLEASLESINGEATPRLFHAGDRIPAGARVLSSREAVGETVENWEESLLERLTAPPVESEDGRIRIDQLIRPYTAVVLTLAAIGGSAWGLADDWVRGAGVAISILVVSCPCALGVALPLCGQLALSRLRRSGLFIRRLDILRRLQRIRRVVFDKTGTLTLERLELENPEALNALGPEARRNLADLVEASLHPVARTLRESLLARHPGLRRDPTTPQPPVNEIPGQGIELTGETGHWRLGRSDWSGESSPADSNGATMLSRDGREVARFHFRDRPRDDLRSTVEELAQLRVAVSLLSGDASSRVDELNRFVEGRFEPALGGLSPDQKADWVSTHHPEEILMIGDGLNDRLAIDRAAASGSPVVEQGALRPAADFLFSGFSLRPIPLLFLQAARYRRTFRQVLQFSIAYNVITVGICFVGAMNPLLAAILMPLSSVFSLALAARTPVGTALR